MSELQDFIDLSHLADEAKLPGTVCREIASEVHAMRARIDELLIVGNLLERNWTRAEKRLDAMRTALCDLLATGWERGHPGEPCMRSPWIREATYIAALRAVKGE